MQNRWCNTRLLSISYPRHLRMLSQSKVWRFTISTRPLREGWQISRTVFVLKNPPIGPPMNAAFPRYSVFPTYPDSIRGGGRWPLQNDLLFIARSDLLKEVPQSGVILCIVHSGIHAQFSRQMQRAHEFIHLQAVINDVAILDTRSRKTACTPA